MRGTHSASTEAIQLGCHEDALCERERALWNQGDSQNPGAELSDQGHIEPAVTMPMRQRTLVTTVIPLLAWVVAGVANYDQFWMGDTPSVLGTTATLVAIGAWPLAGWFSGRRFGSGFIRLASVFWIAVVIGAPALVWAWSSSLMGPRATPRETPCVGRRRLDESATVWRGCTHVGFLRAPASGREPVSLQSRLCSQRWLLLRCAQQAITRQRFALRAISSTFD